MENIEIEKKENKSVHTCTICYDEINTDEFIGKQDFDCVDLHDPTCLRIKCGHAFHTNCIMQAFRGNLKCPMCRDSLIENPLRTFENEYVFQAFEIEEIEEEEVNPEILKLETELNLERCKNKKLIEKRKQLKQKIKHFHEYHTLLKKNRKKILKNSIELFRKENHKVFHKHIKDIQKDLNAICTQEKKIIEKNNKIEITEDSFQNYFNKSNQIYNVYDIIQKNGEDLNINGFLRKFWTL